jgi:hypothetical protein
MKSKMKMPFWAFAIMTKHKINTNNDVSESANNHLCRLRNRYLGHCWCRHVRRPFALTDLDQVTLSGRDERMPEESVDYFGF